MDIDRFINLVYGHKCLWDQSDSTYHLRDHQRKSWQGISEEIKIPVDELKKKWRGLRDTFGRELKKVTKKKSGQAADTEPDSKWPYFKLLLFLRNTMSRRDLEGSVPDSFEISDGDMDFGVEDSVNTSTGSEYPTSASPDQYSSRSYEPTSKKIFKSPFKKKVKRQNTDEINTKLLQIEEEKLKYFQKNANDPDAQFLMSLIPFLKDIPKHRKLMVRTKLQQVLIDEQNAVQFDYSSDSTLHSGNCSMPQNFSIIEQSQLPITALPQQLSGEGALTTTQYSVDYSMPQNNSTQEQSQQSVSILPQRLSDGSALTKYVLRYNPNTNN